MEAVRFAKAPVKVTQRGKQRRLPGMEQKRRLSAACRGPT
jgi:hypothetical protein